MTLPVKQTPGPVAESPPWISPRAAYVHIPFCAHQCWYCDFAVLAGKREFTDHYLSALDTELALQAPFAAPLLSLFLGGGTPTQLDARQLETLFDSIHRRLSLAPTCEVTMEANPNDLTEDKVCRLAALGVNRLSVGVQSFLERHLRFLERSHTPASAIAAIELAANHIANLSIDLIFGIPRQTLGDWEHDLEVVASLPISHVSTYGLTFEKGTRLWKAREHGSVTEADPSLEAEMYERAQDRLEAAGLESYEISNFARAGAASVHNRVYWANHAYLGVGLGAARYIQQTRSVNTRSLGTYLGRLAQGHLPTQSEETLDAEARARETAMVNLRRKEGILRESFREQTGFAIDNLAAAAIRRNSDAGLVQDDGTAIRLTRAGKLMADGVCADFWNPG